MKTEKKLSETDSSFNFDENIARDAELKGTITVDTPDLEEINPNEHPVIEPPIIADSNILGDETPPEQ